MKFRIMLVALVFVAGCTHQIELRPENSEQTKIEKAILKVERLVAADEKPARPEHLPLLQGDGAGEPGLAARHGDPKRIVIDGREFTELPAPHPIDLPQTHPADLPKAEPLRNGRTIYYQGSIPVYNLIPMSSYQYQIAYPLYGKPPTVNERTGVMTYYPTAPGVFEIDAINARIEAMKVENQLKVLQMEVESLKRVVAELLKRK